MDIDGMYSMEHDRQLCIDCLIETVVLYVLEHSLGHTGFSFCELHKDEYLLTHEFLLF